MRDYAASNGTMALSELSEVSARIKELRGRTDLTQYDVAHKLRVPPRTYQSWENGEVETNRTNYAKIGKLFGASANWILFGQEEEPPMPSQNGSIEESATAEILELLREVIGGQEELTARILKVERSLEALRKQQRPAARKRKAGS